MPNINLSKHLITQDVQIALAEDLTKCEADSDISAQIIPADKTAKARVITREDGYFCGKPWADEVFQHINPKINLNWLVKDGDQIKANQTLFEADGNARSLLSAERTVLNFIQLLSAVTTKARLFADLVKNSKVKILDTRKTIPGLRFAQKYAVSCGGCHNHRLGLYDAFLIKENHIAACGGIQQAITTAKIIAPDKTVEIEVENIRELQEAIQSRADIILLDNFNLADMKKAVQINSGQAKLEVSGGVNIHNIKDISDTGVDFISIGSLTKDITALDLSMQFII